MNRYRATRALLAWYHRSPTKLFKNLDLDNTSKIHYPLHLHAINPDTVPFKHGPKEPGTSYHPPPTRASSIPFGAPVTKNTGPRKRKADLADLLTIPHNRLLRIRRLCKVFRIGRISPSFVIERSRPACWPPLIHLRPWPERTPRELLHSVAASDIHMYPVFRALSDWP